MVPFATAKFPVSPPVRCKIVRHLQQLSEMSVPNVFAGCTKMCWSCSSRFCKRAWEMGYRSGRKWILGRKQNLGGFAKPRKLQLSQRVSTVMAHLKLPGSVPAGRGEGKEKAWGGHHVGGHEDWVQSVVNPISPTVIWLHSPPGHFYPSLQPKSQRTFLGWLERRIVSPKYFGNSPNMYQWRKLPGTK